MRRQVLRFWELASFAIILGRVHSQHLISRGVIFRQTQLIEQLRSTWLVTLVYDLTTVQKYVGGLSGNLDAARKIITTIETEYDFPMEGSKLFHNDVYNIHVFAEEGYRRVFAQLKRELANLQRSHTILKSELHTYDLLGGRSKRGLIPILGKALGYIAGLVTTDQLRNVKASIRSLESNQDNIVHELEHQISVVNMSRKYIQENRDAINKLTIGLRDVEDKLDNVTHVLSAQILEIDRFMQIYTQLDIMIAQIRQLIDNAGRYLDNLRVELSFLSLGHISPNIISPKDLLELLNGLKNQIPNGFKLPMHPTRKLWEFYRFLTCSALLDQDRILVLLSVPLLDTDAYYELYSATSLPFAFESASDGSTHGLMASYKLEAETFAIDTHRTKYVFLTAEETNVCLHNVGEYCNIRKATYSVEHSHSCAIALFTKHNEKIERYCQVKVNFNVQLPQALYLDDGTYAIASDREVKLRVTCHRNSLATNLLTIKPPISIIQLELTCTAYNEKITLLPYFFSETKYRPKHDPFLGLLKSTNFSMTNIWEPFHAALPNYTNIELPDNLQKVEDVSMTDFINKIRDEREIRMIIANIGKPFPLWAKFAIGIGAGLLLLIVLVVYKDLITTCLSIKCLGVNKNTETENQGRTTTPTRDCPPTAVTANDESGPELCQTPSVERPVDLPVGSSAEPVSFMTVLDKKVSKD